MIQTCNDKMLKFIGALFILIAILLVVLSTVGTNYLNKKVESYDKVEATITNIVSETYRSNGKNRIRHEAYVEYEYEDKIYESNLNSYSSGMHKGTIVNINVNPDNPYDILSMDNMHILKIIAYALGAVFGVIGILILFNSFKIHGEGTKNHAQ